MRRLLTWLSGVLGGVALYRFLSNRTAPAALPPAPEAPPAASHEDEDAGPDPRADELRARLQESRMLVDEREELEVGETPVDLQAEPPGSSPDERRRRVHEEGRATAARMRRRGERA